jgi:hypothetical protein
VASELIYVALCHLIDEATGELVYALRDPKLEAARLETEKRRQEPQKEQLGARTKAEVERGGRSRLPHESRPPPGCEV